MVCEDHYTLNEEGSLCSLSTDHSTYFERLRLSRFVLNTKRYQRKELSTEMKAKQNRDGL